MKDVCSWIFVLPMALPLWIFAGWDCFQLVLQSLHVARTSRTAAFDVVAVVYMWSSALSAFTSIAMSVISVMLAMEAWQTIHPSAALSLGYSWATWLNLHGKHRFDLKGKLPFPLVRRSISLLECCNAVPGVAPPAPCLQ